MKKKNVLSIGLFITVLVFGIVMTGCQPPSDEWTEPPNLPELFSLKIRINNIDRNVENFGKPSGSTGEVKPGSVTFTSKDEDDLTVDVQSITAFPVSAEFSKSASGGYSKDGPGSLSDGDSLWIRITGTGGTAYYRINITVEYSPVDDFSIKNHPASRSFADLAGWNSAAANIKALKVDMAEAYTGYTYQWYSNTAFSNESGTPIASATNASYTPAITANGTTYYYVIVTLTLEENTRTVTSNAAMIRIDAASGGDAPTQFTIGTDRLNYVRGVGGTGAFMFRTGDRADASPDADVKYIDLLFGELGANILRIMVQDDYENYITNSIQSRNQATFYHNARDNFFPVIRRANEYGGYVFANPWTAPMSMKVTADGGTTASTTLAGGYLRKDNGTYLDYAEHLQNFLKWLNKNNAPIFAIGILNEPDFGGGANYEGMGMNPQTTRDWFKLVGNFTTSEGIIPGFGGGRPTHHVLAMSGDVMGDIAAYMDVQLTDATSNKNIELMGRHYYTNSNRYTRVAGNAPHSASPTAWKDRPQLNYEGPYEAESLEMSPQMYAPGSTARNIKREIWQTEHDFNYHSNSTEPPASNVQNYWNSAFAALNDIDWTLRVAGESVFDWWYSQSYSGLVTGPQKAGFDSYTITPRGRAFAHYARYVNETWFLPITRSKGTIGFNTTISFNAGATDPKISAFEDVNGKFISIVMYTPSLSTAGPNGGSIGSGFGEGGTNGNDNPTRGSTNVGRIEVVMPTGFTASSVSAIRTYGNDIAKAEDAGWTAANPVPAGNPRYWIDEPVILSADGAKVEVNLPAGNVISIMVKGSWSGNREFASPERVRPYTVK